jgi:hypothetical protein
VRGWHCGSVPGQHARICDLLPQYSSVQYHGLLACDARTFVEVCRAAVRQYTVCHAAPPDGAAPAWDGGWEVHKRLSCQHMGGSDQPLDCALRSSSCRHSPSNGPLQQHLHLREYGIRPRGWALIIGVHCPPRAWSTRRPAKHAVAHATSHVHFASGAPAHALLPQKNFIAPRERAGRVASAVMEFRTTQWLCHLHVAHRTALPPVILPPISCLERRPTLSHVKLIAT